MKKQKTKKSEKTNNQLTVEDTENDGSGSSFESNVENSFFYTNDKFINQLDDNELISFIQVKYPKLDIQNDDSTLRKQILLLLNDDEFVEQIFEHFKLSVFEFFGILFKVFQTIFKGPFLKKLKIFMQNKSYVTNTRKQHDY